MTKEEYILHQLRQKYPDLVKEEEISYLIEETNKALTKHNFEKLIKKLDAM